MKYLFLASACVFGLMNFAQEAAAQEVVECRSTDYEYNECYAGSLSRPQLIHQISHSPCILNRSWGYNSRSGYIWVGDGCAGTFADVGGYHHGRGDTYDSGARHYDSAGRDAGALVGGVVLGAILGSVVSGGESGGHRHSTYDGCHGVGCLVSDPDDDGPPEPSQGQAEFD